MKVKTAVLTLILIVLATSCAEVTATSTIKILLHTEAEKTISVGDTALDVTRFSVSGKGPGGKTFAVDSTSASVSIPGMPVGFWEIEAVGYNSKRKEIAKGRASFTLSASENSVSIILTNEVGNGSLQLKYDWDEDLSDPSIILNIISYDKRNKLTRTIKPSSGTTSCTYTVSDLPSGFYTTTSILYNGNQKIIGSAEAVRVANSEKTTGTISFRRGSQYSQDLTSLSLFRVSDNPLTGHFSDTPVSVNSGEATLFSLVLDSSYSISENCTIQWYLDGMVATEEVPLSVMDNYVSFVPQTGAHIVNAIITHPSSSSIGSLSWKFTAETSGIKGSAMYLTTITEDTDSDLSLGTDTVIGALPDNHFCIITPSQNTLSLCSIYNNTITVNSKLSSTDEGFSWLMGTDNIFSSNHMTNFIVTDSNENANFLLFNRAKSKIENALRGGQIARFEKEFGVSVFSVPMSNINTVCFFENSDLAGNIFLSSKDSPLMLSFLTDAIDITTSTMTSKPDDTLILSAMDIKKNKAVAVSENSNTLFSASFNGSEINSIWSSYQTEYQNPITVKLINSENLLISDGESLSRYVYTKSNGWRFQERFDTSVKFLEVSDDGEFFWVITKDDNLETYTTQNKFIHVISTLKLNQKIVSEAKTENYFLLKTDNGNLIVCQISQGV